MSSSAVKWKIAWFWVGAFFTKNDSTGTDVLDLVFAIEWQICRLHRRPVWCFDMCLLFMQMFLDLCKHSYRLEIALTGAGPSLLDPHQYLCSSKEVFSIQPKAQACVSCKLMLVIFHWKDCSYTNHNQCQVRMLDFLWVLYLLFT